MLTVGRAASHDLYYDKSDDYYRGDSQAPSRWFGRGAEELGLTGRIDSADSRAAFAGAAELFGRDLGRTSGSRTPRLPGVDLTFSAPKSLSIMALIAGDERLATAHDNALRATLAHLERSAAARLRDGAALRRETTGKLVVATWRHDTSRAQDPQLHTHAVVINATQTGDGVWRSLDTRPFFTASFAKELGARYRAELATAVRALGYRIEVGADATFEIEGITRADRARFSRRAAQIDQALVARGIDPAKASSAQVKMVVKDTRAAKVAIDHAALKEQWLERAGGSALDRFVRLRQQAEARNPQRSSISASSHPRDHRSVAVWRAGERSRPTGDGAASARAVASAARHLSERNARFSNADLVREASGRAFGRASPTEIERAIEQAAQSGELLPRMAQAYDPALRSLADQPGWTTPQAIRVEQRMLTLLAAGRVAVPPIADTFAADRAVAAAEEASARLGQAWTADQREAARALLVARDRVAVVQGLAGTAKTSTVLATYAATARARGFSVTPLASTGSAALTLGVALDAEAGTVDRFLGRLARGALPEERGRVWIVDEASMLSARRSADLLAAAEAQDARVVLVGDIGQLGSVEAGAAFRQLQENGALTVRLATIVRQTSTATRDAVLAAAQGRVARALERVERGGGSIIEAADAATRRTALADAYMRAHASALRRHGDAAAAFGEVLAIDPSREGRALLTDEIRHRLVASGFVAREHLLARTLERRDLTREEARDALRYRVGDVIRFGSDLRRQAIAAGEHLRVAAVDPGTNTLCLERRDGGRLFWAPHARGAKLHVTDLLAVRERPLALGDRITLTRNDSRGWANGTAATVLAIDPVTRRASIRIDDGARYMLALDQAQDQHWRHGYVATAHAAQGRTTGEVFAHVESWRVNLIHQQSFYVMLSRARRTVHLYTDERSALVRALIERTGQRGTALDADRVAERPGSGRIRAVLDRLAARAELRWPSLTERLATVLGRMRSLMSRRRAQTASPSRDRPARQPAR